MRAERLGPLIEVTSGDNWALIAWKSEFGVCLDFAIPGARYRSPARWVCLECEQRDEPEVT